MFSEDYELRVAKEIINSFGNNMADDYVLKMTVKESNEAFVSDIKVLKDGADATLDDIREGSFEIKLDGYNLNKTTQKMTVIVLGKSKGDGVEKVMSVAHMPITVSNGEEEFSTEVTFSDLALQNADKVTVFVWSYPLQHSIATSIVME